jgi:hypothetical protein
MLFGGIDWEQVLIKGVVGGLVGLLTGYVLWRARRNEAKAQEAAAADKPLAPNQERRAARAWRGTGAGRRKRLPVVLVILAVDCGVVLFVLPRLTP